MRQTRCAGYKGFDVTEQTDKLAAARGILNGLILVAPFWAVVCLIVTGVLLWAAG